MEENTSKEHRKLLFKHEQYGIEQLGPATDNLRWKKDTEIWIAERAMIGQQMLEFFGSDPLLFILYISGNLKKIFELNSEDRKAVYE